MQVLRRPRRAVVGCMNAVRWTHLVEGVSEHDQLVQQTPERPEVRREIVRLAANHLLRAVASMCISMVSVGKRGKHRRSQRSLWAVAQLREESLLPGLGPCAAAYNPALVFISLCVGPESTHAAWCHSPGSCSKVSPRLFGPAQGSSIRTQAVGSVRVPCTQSSTGIALTRGVHAQPPEVRSFMPRPHARGAPDPVCWGYQQTSGTPISCQCCPVIA